MGVTAGLVSAPDPRQPLLRMEDWGVGAGAWVGGGRDLGEGMGEGVLQGCWSPGSALCTPAQGLPGPSGEKGETGDVGPMVSATPLTGWTPPDSSLTC